MSDGTTAAGLVEAAPPYVFALLAGAALRQWAVRRDRPGRELAAMFTVLAGVLLLAEALPAEQSTARTVLSRLVLLGLVTFPYLLLRFAAAFEALPAWLRRGGTAAYALTAVSTVVLPTFPDEGAARPGWLTAYTLLVIAEWAFLSFAVTWRLWVAGARLPRVARVRMRILGAGAAVLVAGLVGAVAPGTDGAVFEVGAPLLASSSGLLFLGGFAPPSWLVRTWRGDSAAVQRLLVGLVGETEGQRVAGTVLPRLCELVGARGAALVDGGGAVVAASGTTPAAIQPCPEDGCRPLAEGVGLVTTGQLRVALDDGALHVWTGPYAPYFGRTELGLLASFGALLQLSLQRATSYARERAASAALEEAQELSGIGSWRWATNAAEPVWSAQMHRLFGLPPGTPLTDAVWATAIHPDDRERVDAELARAMTSGEDVVLEHRLVRPDGDLRWVQSRVQLEVAADGTVTGLFGTSQDITERRQLERELQHQALHDPMTGLPNRPRLVELIAAAVDDPDRGTAVLLLDVDRFKIVNDGLGHEMGDQVILAVAERLTAVAGERDVVGRFGGDEFVVVADVADETEALELAEDLRAALAEPVAVGSTELVVTLSVGIALSLGARLPAGALVRDADAAVHAAKRAGGDRAVLFADAMREEVVDRLAVEVDLRRALLEDQLRLHYQPIFDTVTGALVGAEALVRWQHPTRGLLGPAEFIGVAEETGLIVDLGAEVLRKACAQLRLWQDGHAHLRRMRMSVNVSALQVFGSGLPETVAEAVHGAGIAPECLTLEITESVLMTDVEDALGVLGALRRLGVHLSVDDFGTGYSSLAYLTRLPVSSLKVDKSFLAHLDEDPHARAVVQAVVALASTLGLSIVAEGVETDAQLTIVRRLGCGFAQGFGLGRPVPAEQWGPHLAAPAAPAVTELPRRPAPVLPAPRGAEVATGS